MPRRHAPAALVAVLAALGAACGEEGPTDQEAVRSALVGLAEATRAKDYDRLCDRVLDRALVAEVEESGLPCEAAVERGFEDVEDPRLTIGRITIDGDRASAEVRSSAAGQEPSRDVVRLVRRPEGWRVSALAEPAGAEGPRGVP